MHTLTITIEAKEYDYINEALTEIMEDIICHKDTALKCMGMDYSEKDKNGNYEIKWRIRKKDETSI